VGWIIRWLVTLHLDTSQYKTLCIGKQFIYSRIIRLPKQLLNYHPKGRRRPGRPLKRLLDDVTAETETGHPGLNSWMDMMMIITRQYIHWVALLLLRTKQSDRQVIKPRTKTVSSWSKLCTRAPICKGCRLPLSRPLHSQPSGSPFGTNSIEKGHVSGALFSPTDLTQRLHVAIWMSRITKKSRQTHI
jgi:hypothetical protein